jgi:hypothetical protein
MTKKLPGSGRAVSCRTGARKIAELMQGADIIERIAKTTTSGNTDLPQPGHVHSSGLVKTLSVTWLQTDGIEPKKGGAAQNTSAAAQTG